MSRLLLRNDDGSWAGKFPSIKEDLENQHRIIAEAIAQARAEALEDAAKVAEQQICSHLKTATGYGWLGPEIAAAIRALKGTE